MQEPRIFVVGNNSHLNYRQIVCKDIELFDLPYAHHHNKVSARLDTGLLKNAELCKFE